jgi:hypothetical protein
MKAVLLGTEDLPDQPAIETGEFLKWSLQIDRVYQGSARWFLLSPYLNQLAYRRVQDIRGYYYLMQLDGRDQKLAKFAALPDAQKTQILGWLQNMCENTRPTADCQSELSNEARSGNVSRFFSHYQANSARTYEAFFRIPKSIVRSDARWSNDGSLLEIPFASLDSAQITDFLRLNIEDEWHWNDWHLRLGFTPGADVHVRFQEGATPHVNGLGGNEITMDANSPLEEYDVQWTIRHEFGHVLGFPDCYLEYYDRDAGVMTSYQIDTSDLMCSRRGHFKQRHFDDLKESYGGNLR